MPAKLDANKALLVVIDVQGALAEAMAAKEALFSNLDKMVKGAKVLDLPLIWTEQVPEKLGPTIAPLASHMEGAEPISKSCFNCSKEPRFMKTLSKAGKAQVIICGIEAHICVFQTAVDLVERKYQVFVAADAISSRETENKRIALERMKEAGVSIVSVEMALFEMLGDATGEKFREILKIIK